MELDGESPLGVREGRGESKRGAPPPLSSSRSRRPPPFPPLQAVPAALSRALASVSRALDLVTDAVYEAAAPASMSRGAVDAAVKVGALLLALSFARSLLGLVVTVGSVGLAAYVWSKANEGGGRGGGGRGDRGFGR